MLCASKDNHRAEVSGLHLVHGEAGIADEDEGSWGEVVVACHGPVTVSCTQSLDACLRSFGVRGFTTRTSRGFEFRDERALTVARDVGNPD